MKFSIRGMLACTMLAAVALMIVMNLTQLRRDETQSRLLQNQIEIQREALQLGTESQRARQHALDRLATISASREIAENKFEQLREKYGGIVRQGDAILSLRLLPKRSTDPLRLRMIVPETRPVWLKFGMTKSRTHQGSSKLLDQVDDWLDARAVSGAGPFESLLTPGDRTLEIHAVSGEGEPSRLVIRHGEEVLLDATFRSRTIGIRSYISPRQQSDYAPKRDLPWLLTGQLETGEDQSTSESQYRFSVWLSGEPSQFEAFPGSVQRL